MECGEGRGSHPAYHGGYAGTSTVESKFIRPGAAEGAHTSTPASLGVLLEKLSRPAQGTTSKDGLRSIT